MPLTGYQYHMHEQGENLHQRRDISLTTVLLQNLNFVQLTIWVRTEDIL